MTRALLIVLLLLGRAAAQPALDESKREAASKLVAEGSTRFDAKDFQGALEKYDAAFAIYPAPKIHFNRGLALAGLGKKLEAADAYAQFLDGATDAPAAARAQATKQLAALDRDLGKLAIDSSVANATIAIDGKDFGVAPRTVRVWPGKRAIRVVAAGRPPWEHAIDARAGETTAVKVVLAEPIDLRPQTVVREDRAPPPIAPVREVDTSRPIYGRWYFWAGIAAVVAGGIAIAVLASSSDEAPESELGTIDPFRTRQP